MASAEFYKRPSAEITVDTARLEMVEAALADVYLRWETLETIAGAES
jgi:hypothetical protein